MFEPEPVTGHSMTAATPPALYAEWVAEAKEAAAQLRQRVIEAKHNEEGCCDVLNHALEAVLSLEHAVYAGRLNVQQKQQLPDILAAILSNIQLAQSVVQVRVSMVSRVCHNGSCILCLTVGLVQVSGRHWQLSSCTCVPWSQSYKRKLSSVSDSLQNIAHKTRELQIASLEENNPRCEHTTA